MPTRFKFTIAKSARAVLVLALVSAIALPLLVYAAGRGVTLHPKTQQQFLAAELLVQGSQLVKQKQPFKARTTLEQAAALWPEEPQVHFNLGVCYAEAGDFPRAIDQYKEALGLDPTLTECYPDIASCYQLMNDYAAAISNFETYLSKEPNAPDAPQIKGMILALQRQSAKQVDSDPQAGDYFGSIMRNGCPERWQKDRLPLKIFISNGTDERGAFVNGFQSYFNDILLQCFDTWIKASDYKLAYQLVDNASQADIVCTWTDRKDFLQGESTSVEQGAARLRSRFFPTLGQNQILSARVLILIVNPTNGQLISDDDIKKTCLHEVGHALGLSGHSNNNKDVMFYSESPTVWAALTRRDKNTICHLYADFPVFSWNWTPQPYAQQPYPQQPYAQLVPYQQQR